MLVTKILFSSVFSVSQIVLQVKKMIPGSRSYLPAEELVWDSGSGGGPTPLSLRHRVAEHLSQAVEHTIIAKHLPDKYEWIVIKHLNHYQVCAFMLNS